jgi:hypothetical protein
MNKRVSIGRHLSPYSRNSVEQGLPASWPDVTASLKLGPRARVRLLVCVRACGTVLEYFPVIIIISHVEIHKLYLS